MTALLVFVTPVTGEAQIVCDFKDQTEALTTTSPNAFPGCAGGGWKGPWQVRRYLPEGSERKNYQGLDGIDVVSGMEDGSTLLTVRKSDKVSDRGVGIARAYESSPAVDITKPYLISLVVRMEKMPHPESGLSNNYLFVGENSTDAVGPNSSTVWFVQAFYGTDIGKPVVPGKHKHRLNRATQLQWNLVNKTDQDDEMVYATTGVPLEEGVDYHIKIAIDPTTSSYQFTIRNGSEEYTSDSLKFLSNRPPGGTLVIGSMHTEEDPAVFSIKDIQISAR